MDGRRKKWFISKVTQSKQIIVVLRGKGRQRGKCEKRRGREEDVNGGEAERRI